MSLTLDASLHVRRATPAYAGRTALESSVHPGDPRASREVHSMAQVRRCRAAVARSDCAEGASGDGCRVAR